MRIGSGRKIKWSTAGVAGWTNPCVVHRLARRHLPYSRRQSRLVRPRSVLYVSHVRRAIVYEQIVLHDEISVLGRRVLLVETVPDQVVVIGIGGWAQCHHVVIQN